MMKTKMTMNEELKFQDWVFNKTEIEIDGEKIKVLIEEEWGNGDGEFILNEIPNEFLPEDGEHTIIEIYNIEDFKNKYVKDEESMIFYSPDNVDGDEESDDFQLIIIKC